MNFFHESKGGMLGNLSCKQSEERCCEISTAAITVPRSRSQHPNFWETKTNIKTQPAMPKLPECDRCLLFAHNPHLVCAVHPAGPNTNTCIDFRENPDAEPDELWEPEGASYYSGELILQPPQRWTLEQQLELLDTHPLFTGRCPQCEMT
ncbi:MULTISPECIES: hypothetical protein [unclassified Microcoleus]|uniref:hypothetical protein n=1 Tax=unclassified Microcoleus TaxID=2642155 RepID=UPI002FCFF857